MDKTNIYHIYNSKTINKDSCIEIQIGKQKKKRFKDSSLFFSADSFIQLEKTIWDNFREYFPNSVVKISSKEWLKIIEGLKELSILLKAKEYNNEMLEILNYKLSYDQKMYKENYILINSNIDNMVSEFITWLEHNVKTNDYMTITA